MKNLYAAFETDKGLETNGIVLDFGGPKFYVRRAGGANRRYSAVFQEKCKPYKQAMAARTLEESVMQKILIDVYFETVIIKWENVQDRDGNDLAFTHENFEMVMTDLPELWNTIVTEADSLRNFQLVTAKADGEALGN